MGECVPEQRGFIFSKNGGKGATWKFSDPPSSWWPNDKSQKSLKKPCPLDKRIFFRIVYAKLYGVETILSQISVQDSARLLNEFEYRIDQLVKV